MFNRTDDVRGGCNPRATTLKPLIKPIGHGPIKTALLVSEYTDGVVRLNVDDLSRLFPGKNAHAEVPLTAYAADVTFKAGRVVTINWHCYATEELLFLMVPALYRQELADREQYAGFKKPA